MKIAIGSDHGGFQLKKEIIKYLRVKQYDLEDFGTYNLDSCDYPDIAIKVSEEVVMKNYDLGILICGTGIGIGIAANKVYGIRAALCNDTFSAHRAREHNDANILTMGGSVIGVGLALDIVEIFLNAKFLGGRHQRRIDKIADIETKYKNNIIARNN